jgi:N-acetylglucosaminyldiphosphoundecaprenol N-acetyl-beta-D-mannosaminyltransferase
MKIMGLTFRGAYRSAVETPEPGRCKFVITVNADFIVRARGGDERLHRLVDGHISTFDGFWPWLIARLRYPGERFDKISGSDLVYHYADQCRIEGRSLLIVGGSAHAAAFALDNRAGTSVAIGWEAPFEAYPMSTEYITAFREQILTHKPLAIAVCLGSPKQEFLIEDHLDFMSAQGVSFVYGAGGTADMVAGKFKRAPVIIQNIGLEGLWRLITEPSVARLKRIANSARIFRYCLD